MVISCKEMLVNILPLYVLQENITYDQIREKLFNEHGINIR